MPPVSDDEFHELKNSVALLTERLNALSARVTGRPTARSADAAGFDDDEPSDAEVHQGVAEQVARGHRDLVDAGALELAVLQTEAETIRQRWTELKRVAGRDDEESRVLASVSFAFALMASHWRLSRARVQHVVAPSEKRHTALVAVPAHRFAQVLAAVLHTFAEATAVPLGAAMSEPIAVVVKRLGGEPFFADAPLYESVLRAVSERESVGEGDFVLDDRDDGTRGATATIDPHHLFLYCDKTLGRLAQELSENPAEQGRKVSFGGSPSRRRERESGDELRGLAADLESLAGDPLWRVFFERMDAERFRETWKLVDTLIATAARRLAWALHCRDAWNHPNASTTVTFDPSFQEPTPAHWSAAHPEATHGPSTWRDGNLDEFPRGAWTALNGWPEHFESEIVPDFQGWEHDPESAFHGDDGRMVAHAHLRIERMSHVSLAVLHCCQVRPERGYNPVDLLAPEGAARLKRYSSPKQSERQGKPPAKEVTIAEIRFGNARWGEATGKWGRMVVPTTADAPFVPAIDPTALTVVVESTSRVAMRPNVYLLGPMQDALTRDANGSPQGPLLFKEEKVVSLMKSRGVTWRGLQLPQGVYAITLGPADEAGAGGEVTISDDCYYFEIP